MRRVGLGNLVDDLGALGVVFLAQHRGDLVELRHQLRMGRHEGVLGALDHARDERIEHDGGALERDQLLGGRDRGGRRRLGAGGTGESKACERQRGDEREAVERAECHGGHSLWHRKDTFQWSMILSENRGPLFGIMLFGGA